MATHAGVSATAELWLISDFPIDESHLKQIRQLFGERTSDGELRFRSDRKICTWPLRVSYECGDVIDPSFQAFLCASFLKQRRAVVDRIHALGCNLELCVHVQSLTKYFSLPSATMKQLADLDIQFSLMPAAAERENQPPPE